MAGKTTATRNALVDTEAALGTWISLHTADPGTTGASEATGGSPAYARKQTTWGAASSGVRLGSQVTFDVPAGTYTHWAVWSLVSGGTVIDAKALTASEVYAGQGEYKLTPTLSAPA